MNVTTEEQEYCKIKATYTADASLVKEKKDELISFFHKQKVKGFRKNKAPKVVVANMFKKQIEAELKNTMLIQAYDDVIFETKMRPIGQPQPLKVELKGNEFTCEMEFLKKPDFDLKDVSTIKVPKPHSKVNEIEMAEKTLQDLRINAGSYNPYNENDFVQMGDKVTMSLEVAVEEVKIESFSGDGKVYVVGSGMFDGFDDNILGMTPGEDREFEVMYEGRRTNIKTSIHMGMRQIPHALDDSLAKVYGKETLAELRNEVVGMTTAQVKNELDAQITEQTKKQLLAMHDFEVPVWLQKMEAQQIAVFDKIDLNTCSAEVLTHYMDRAKDNVKLSLIFDSLQQTIPEAMLSDNEATEILKQNLTNQGYNLEAVFGNKENQNKLYGMMISVKNEHTMKYVVSKVEIVE